MLRANEHHLIRRAGKTPVDRGWPRLSTQDYNDHRANAGEVGLVCGDICVLDIDIDKNTGQMREETLEALMALDLPPTLKVQTPSGGWHYFFLNEKEQMLPRRINIAPGIDWLGQNGYVALYEPLSQYDPDEMNGIPASVIELLSAPQGGSERIEHTTREGGRNETLTSFCGAWFKQGMTYTQVMNEAQRWGANCQPAMDPNEVAKVVGSVSRYHAPAEPEPEPEIEVGQFWESIDEVLALELPAMEPLCGPLYSSQVTMAAGRGGVGKSLFILQLAARIAAGQDFGTWETPRAARVLYVDGEMATQFVQGRLVSVPKSDNLQLMHLDLMRRHEKYVDMSATSWRNWFLRDEVCGQFDLIVFDTVSSILLAHEDGEMFSPEYWLQLEPFHREMRAKSKAVLWVDNLNKYGEVFGTAVKHHKVDAMWRFDAWKDKPADATAGFDLKLDKVRGDQTGECCWYMSPVGWFQA